MKRRISIGILCLVMLALCLFALSSCNGSCDHEWGDWNVLSQATCTGDGQREHTCTKCGWVERESISSTGHAYSEWTITTPATCTEEGVKTRVCANCSETEEATTYALGHTYGSWINEVSNTCATDGIKGHYFCSRCNKNYDKDNNLIEDLVIPAAHKFGTSWGYKDETGHAHLCTVCGAVGEIAAHTPGDEATPTTPQVCTVCQYIIAPATGHVCQPDEAWDFDSTHHWHGCTGCEEQQYNKGTHTYDNACDTTCNVCGAVRATVHTYDNSCDTTCNVCGAVREINHTYDNNCDTTCNVCGFERTVNHVFDGDCDEECNLCGFTRTVNHTYETITVPATCERQEVTYLACSECGKIDSTSYSYTPIADCQESYSVTTEPTCSAAGVGTYTCLNCEKTRTVTLPKTAHTYTESVVEPSCEAGGYTLHECVCGDSYVTDETAPLNHNYVRADGECTDADCENDGKEVEICSNCDDRKETIIPATGHDMVEATCTSAGYCRNCDKVGDPIKPHSYQVKEDVPATCTEDGKIVYKCENCDSEYTEVPDNYIATGHNEAEIIWDKSEEKIEGTTCDYRIVATGECPDCHQTVTKTGEIFQKHNYTCAITTPATCSEKGTKTYTCVCGDSYRSEYEDADAHTWNAGVTEGGITTYTCTSCSATRTEIAAADNQAISSDAINSSEQIKLENATVSLDEGVKGQVGTDDVKLSAGILDGEELNNAIAGLDGNQLALLGDSKVYNFTMSIGDTETAEFNGFITIRVPYDLGDEDPENITVWYLKDGVPTLVEAKYIIIDNQGYAEFSTNHFSYYTVSKMTPAERCEIYGHAFVEQVLPATCLEGGYTLNTCRRCGHKEYSEETSALGHDYRVISETPATCTENGHVEYGCSRCNVSYTTTVKATGHDWHLDSTDEASCSSTGANHYVCSGCDATYDTVIPKLAHTFGEGVVTEATCTKSGYTTLTCSVCGHSAITDRTPALGHDFKDTVVAPTCVSGGYTSHVCERCGLARANTDITPATGHEWNMDSASCTEDKVCIHCNERGEKALGHEYSDGVCVRCDYVCAHEHTEYSHDIAPTCENSGYKVHLCSVCHTYINAEEIPATGHSYELFEEVGATCTESGYRTEKCSVCGSRKTEITEAPTGHDYENGICGNCGIFCDHSHTELVSEAEADCTNAGYRTVECADCGTRITTVTEEALGHNIVNGVCDRCGIACEHNSFVYSHDIAPTCTTPGYRVEKCSGCGQENKIETTPALGHNYVNGRCTVCFEYCEHENLTYSHDNAATCQQVGHKIYVCDDCGLEVEGEEIPVVDHNYVTVSETAPTCTEAGSRTEKCSMCGTERVTETAPALGHTPAEAVEENRTEATCTEDGHYESVVYCSVCHAKLSGETVTIPATGHSYTDGVCDVCGEQEETDENFYYNMLMCWSDFRGAAIKVEDFSFIMSIPADDGTQSAIMGSIKADLAELVLYIDENGDLRGAAYGSATIFNGPVQNEDATFTLSAVISGDYVYIVIIGESESQGEERMSMTVSVDDILANIKSSIFGSEENFTQVMGLITDKVLPLFNKLLEGNTDKVDSAIEAVLDLLFSKEAVEGGYVFTLDYEKIEQINTDLATLTVKEFVDKYIGEGTFDSAIALISEILDLEISAIPDYLTEKGLPTEDIFDLVNTFASFATGSEFDIEAYLSSPELEGVTVGLMMFDTEDYLAQLESMADMLTESPLYALFAEDPSAVQSMVSQYIAMVKEMLSFSFTTDRRGIITSVAIDVAVENIPSGSYNTSVSMKLTVTPDGRIDVTWDDIADEINNAYGAPAIEDETTEVYFDMKNYSTEFEYQGVLYMAQASDVRFYYTERTYSRMFSAMITKDCGDWNLVNYSYFSTLYGADYSLMTLIDPETGKLFTYLFVNKQTGEAVQLIMNEGSFDYVKEDGTQGSFTLTEEEFSSPELTCKKLAEELFGGIGYEAEMPYTNSLSYYYNTVTGEFAQESHHNFEIDEEASYEPTDCGTDGCEVYVCSECGKVQRHYYNNFEHSYVVDPEHSYVPSECGQQAYRTYVCTECGDSYRSYFTTDHEWEYTYELEKGAESCLEGVYIFRTCTMCGETREYGKEYRHQLEGEFTYSDGVVSYTAHCAACGQAPESSGNFVKVDTEEEIEYVDVINNEVIFSFVPTASGYYCFYSTEFSGSGEKYHDTFGSIYDGNMILLESNDDLGSGHFGIKFYFEAGKTYYLGARLYSSELESNAFTIKLEPVTETVVDLSEYCSCGSTLHIVKEFGNTDYYVTDEDCTCGFSYEFMTDFYNDENCNEIRKEYLIFYNENNERIGEYVLANSPTGNSSHGNTTSDSQRFEEEGTDEDGNYVKVVTEKHFERCDVCGNIVYSDTRIDTYDENGVHLTSRYERSEWSGEAGALVLSYSEETGYILFTDNDGTSITKTLYRVYTKYNSLGEPDYLERTDYNYVSACECIVTRTDIYGNKVVSTEFYHNTSEKELPDESRTYEYEEDGKTYYVTVSATERYCVRCHASIEKIIETAVYDANGHLVKITTDRYSPYAHSADESGWILDQTTEYTYGVYEYTAGKYATYELTYTWKDYDEFGMITGFNGRRYDYVYGNYCDYDEYATYGIDGKEEYRGQGTRHIKISNVYRLHDGAESCTDGLDYYEVCICGYEYLIGENWNYYHTVDETTVQIIDLSEYGSHCGTVAEIKACVCKEKYYVNVIRNDELDFDRSWSSDYDGDEVRYNYNRYTYGCPVTDPEICSFTYTYEYWYTTDGNCNEYYHERYVFGVGTDNPYELSFSYATGNKRHDTEHLSHADEVYVEDGYTVTVSGSSQVCSRCGQAISSTVNTYFRDENGKTVKEYHDYTYYNSNGIKSRTEHYEYVLFEVNNSNGTLSELVCTYEKDTYFDTEGNVTYWKQYTYTYSDCVYSYRVDRTDSDGNTESYQREHSDWAYDFDYYVVEPTCTQDGVEHRSCRWCLKSVEIERGNLGHSYYSNEEGTYTCARCGLTNFTGYDGEIIFEDLTAKRGNGEYFVVGYCKYNEDQKEEYMLVLSLVVEGLDEPIFLDTVAEDDGRSLIYISIDEVKAEVEGLGYSLYSDSLRVTFIPTFEGAEIDYSITLDPLAEEVTAE